MPDIATLPSVVNVRTRRGDSWRLDVTLPFAIAGYTITATLYRQSAADVPITVANKETDEVRLSLTAEQTAALAADSFPWEMHITTPAPDSFKRTYFSGRFTIEAPEFQRV